MTKKHEKIIFYSEEKRIELDCGEVYKTKRINNYRDTPEKTLVNIVDKIKAGHNWKDIIKNEFEMKNPWLYKIITSKQRTLYIDNYPLKENSLILDIGSGWGQFSLPLARSHVVCSIEPTPEKLDFIKAVAVQEKIDENIFFIGEDYLNINFENKFDYALCIGVLEWIGSFSNENPQDVQKNFLIKVKRELKQGGHIIIGIENRIGLKYILGTNDDHTSLPNISLYDSELAKYKYKNITGKELKTFTYSKKELEELLYLTGFKNINFFAALPDYKIPEKIIPIKRDMKYCINNDYIPEHDGSNGVLLSIQNELKSLYASIDDVSIFVPSFFIVAS